MARRYVKSPSEELWPHITHLNTTDDWSEKSYHIMDWLLENNMEFCWHWDDTTEDGLAVVIFHFASLTQATYFKMVWAGK